MFLNDNGITMGLNFSIHSREGVAGVEGPAVALRLESGREAAQFLATLSQCLDSRLEASEMLVAYRPFFPRPIAVDHLLRGLTSQEGRTIRGIGLATPGVAKERYWNSALSLAVWQHSVRVAHGAEFIALWCRAPVSPELAYLSGLLHDMAIPLLAEPTDLPPGEGVWWEGGGEAKIGEHPKLAARLARLWGIPVPVCDVIRHHHDWHSSCLEVKTGREPSPILGALLAWADLLAESPTMQARASRPCDAELLFMDHLGVTPERRRHLLEDMVDLMPFFLCRQGEGW